MVLNSSMAVAEIIINSVVTSWFVPGDKVSVIRGKGNAKNPGGVAT